LQQPSVAATAALTASSSANPATASSSQPALVSSASRNVPASVQGSSPADISATHAQSRSFAPASGVANGSLVVGSRPAEDPSFHHHLEDFLSYHKRKIEGEFSAAKEQLEERIKQRDERIHQLQNQLKNEEAQRKQAVTVRDQQVELNSRDKLASSSTISSLKEIIADLKEKTAFLERQTNESLREEIFELKSQNKGMKDNLLRAVSLACLLCQCDFEHLSIPILPLP